MKAEGEKSVSRRRGASVTKPKNTITKLNDVELNLIELQKMINDASHAEYRMINRVIRLLRAIQAPPETISPGRISSLIKEMKALLQLVRCGHENLSEDVADHLYDTCAFIRVQLRHLKDSVGCGKNSRTTGGERVA